jgi:DnaJ-class molecular chaperone
MPAVGKPKERGDLYATADVQLPKKLNAEERKLFEKLKDVER